MGKRKLVLVFDNTMGIPHCDVDDGLAFLYLLGREEIEILGLVACFGNSSTEQVYRNTEKLLAEIGNAVLKLPEIREEGAFREAFYSGISASLSEKSVLD